MEKNKELRKAIKKVFTLDNKLACAVQQIEQYLKFEGFRWEEPICSMCLGGELILTYKGKELFHEEFIRLMEENGVITPSDFYNYGK